MIWHRSSSTGVLEEEEGGAGGGSNRLAKQDVEFPQVLAGTVLLLWLSKLSQLASPPLNLWSQVFSAYDKDL